MFTGIVYGHFPIIELNAQSGLLSIGVKFPENLLEGLQIGASVAVDGVCLTVVQIEGFCVKFDVIQETLDKTTLSKLSVGDFVNIERSLKYGDEIGGHFLSGHIMGTATIEKVVKSENNHELWFSVCKDWIKYIFPKGYIAIDGASLTVVEVEGEREEGAKGIGEGEEEGEMEGGRFSVHLIPETLRTTTLGKKEKGGLVNIEIDSMTQATVDSIYRRLANK